VNYTQASRDPQLDRQKYNALLEILLLPQRCLIRSRGGKKRLIRGVSKQLTASNQVTTKPLLKKSQDPTKGKVAKAVYLAQQGYLSRGTSALFQEPLRSVDEEVIDAVRALHPAADALLPDLPNNAPEVKVDPEQLARSIKKVANGAAPAGSGWTGELLLALVDDADCMTGIECIITDILNGDLPVAEVFYKVATHYVLAEVQAELNSIVAPIQLAFATGGSETALHLLQTAVLDKSSMAVSVDITNAFNTRSRGQILEELYNHPQLNFLWRIANFSYGKPSHLLLMDNGRIASTFLSQQGVRQGDVLGSALFALSMDKLYNAIDNPDVVRVAIMDDLYIVGHSLQVADSFDRFEKLVSAHDTGLAINFKKSMAILPTKPAPENKNFLDKWGITVCQEMPALGAIVGRDRGAHKEWLLSKLVKTHETLFKTLRHIDMPVQHCIQFLRTCMLPRMNYWTRVLPPSVVYPAAAKFDSMMKETLMYKLQLSTLEGEAQKLYKLPIRLGGLGLRSMVEVSPIAYFSALAQASFIIRESLPLLYMGNSKPDYSMKWCYQVFQDSRIKFDGKLLPKSSEDFWKFYGAKQTQAGLQREITKLIEDVRGRVLLEEAKTCKPRLARLVSSRAKYAGSWLTAPLGNPHFRLPNKLFSLAVRLRLGLPPQDNLPLKCTCGAFLARDPHHFLSCNQRLKTTMTLRHDKLLYLLAKLARMGNITTQVEVPLEEMKRPDINFYLLTRTLATDVTVIHPSAKTYQSAAARPLGAAEVRERKKNNDYEEKSRKEGLAFQPFVMETYGAFGKEASDILSELATEATQNGVLQIGGMKFSLFAVRALAACLQWGNAMVMLKGCTLARRAA